MSASGFFDSFFEQIEAIAQTRGQLTKPDIFSTLVNVPKMQEYLAEFYGSDFSNYLNDCLVAFRANPLRSKGNFNAGNAEPYLQFAQSDDFILPSGARFEKTYPLTREEMIMAEQRYGQSERLFIALASFQAGTAEYFLDIKRDADQFPWRLTEKAQEFVSTQIKQCATNAYGLSFWHDLYPVMLSSLKTRAENFQGVDAQMALTCAFKKSTFKSYGPNGAETEEMLCPFGKAIGHLFQTKFIEDENGGLSVAPYSEPGALIMFLADKGEAMMNLWPHLRKVPDGTDDPALLFGS